MTDSIQSEGGRARSRSLTPARRKEIAREAANARWGRKDRRRPTLRIKLSYRALAILESLRESGLHGHTIEEAAERLLCERLRAEVK